MMRRLAAPLFLLLVFTIPWETVVEHPLLGSASRVAGFAAAGVWSAGVLVTGRLRRADMFHVVLFLYIAWNAATIFWSADAGRTMTHIGTWVQLFVLSLILWNVCTTRDAVLRALQAYVLGAYVVVGNTVLNYLRGDAFYYERFSAAGTNPDDAGLVLALGIPMAAYLTAFPAGSRSGTILRTLNALYLLGAFVGIVLSGTRTAMLVAAPGVVFAAALLGRAKPTRPVIVALLFATAAVSITPVIPAASLRRLGTTGSELTSGDLNGRIAVWREGLEAFEEHPLIGVGSNMFRSVNVKGKVAHNSFLSVLVELGSIGFVLLMTVIGVAAARIFRHEGWERWLWVSLFVGWAIGASALTWEHRKGTWLLFNLVVASAAAQSFAVASRLPGRRPAPSPTGSRHTMQPDLVDGMSHP